MDSLEEGKSQILEFEKEIDKFISLDDPKIKYLKKRYKDIFETE